MLYKQELNSNAKQGIRNAQIHPQQKYVPHRLPKNTSHKSFRSLFLHIQIKGLSLSFVNIPSPFLFIYFSFHLFFFSLSLSLLPPPTDLSSHTISYLLIVLLRSLSLSPPIPLIFLPPNYLPLHPIFSASSSYPFIFLSSHLCSFTGFFPPPPPIPRAFLHSDYLIHTVLLSTLLTSLTFLPSTCASSHSFYSPPSVPLAFLPIPILFHTHFSSSPYPSSFLTTYLSSSRTRN